MQREDWLSPKKEEQLAMGKSWVPTLNEKQMEWGVPVEKITNLAAALSEAETENSIPVGERSKVSNSRLKIAFNTLTGEMRDIKRRYFFVPPLTNTDLIGLGLKPKDTIPTSVTVPKVRALGKIAFKSSGSLDLHIAPETDISEDKRAYYGCKIAYAVMNVDELAPKSEKELTESIFTRRKKEAFIFQPQDAAKKVYFSLRYENSKGQAGPWCPIFAAVIP